MISTSVYLNFDGDCEKAFKFYEKAIDGKITMLSRFSEMPPDPNHPPLPEKYNNQIMHATLSFGEDCTIMGSDQPEEFGPPRTVGNNFSVSLGTDSRKETEEVFGRLQVGGQVTMPLADTFWGSYFGMCTDQFGVSWMVSYDTLNEAT